MPQLSIVVPALNEAGNVAELRGRLSAALPGIDWG
jgi:glycosyltransferase involved in cell wall biosynthesis